jgi:hypothetical protein
LKELFIKIAIELKIAPTTSNTQNVPIRYEEKNKTINCEILCNKKEKAA